MAFMIEKRQQQAMDAITNAEMKAAAGGGGEGGLEMTKAASNGNLKEGKKTINVLDMPPIVMYGEHEEEVDDQDEGIIPSFQRWIIFSCKLHKTAIVRAVLFCLFVAYWVYFGFAVAYDLELAISLIVMTGIVIFCIVYVYIRNRFGERIYKCCFMPIGVVWDRTWPTTRWFILPGLLILLILYLAFFVILEFRQLRSLVGMVVFFGYTYLISKHPGKVVWRPIIWGFALQFLFAILVLRWTFGYEVIKFLSVQIMTFVEYAYDGAATVFGNPTLMFHPFSMMGMSLLIWIGSVMAVLYYVGFTQILAEKMAWLMLVTMKTTAIETLSVAANIFLNGMDVMIMLRPYLHRLTRSEFHCLLVGGHATVAGFAFAIFVMFGAPPEHLLTAAVMSAPATIAIAKLSWPETEGHLSVTKNMEDVKLTRGDDTNVFEASANGASIAGKTATAVMLNYISFIAFLYWVNATLDWIGDHVGYDGLSFEEICSYVMWPVVVIMGVDLADARESAMLVGLKVFASEILAFQRLGVSVRSGRLSPRSQAITTYALSGFSSISTLAIAVGVWRAICPQKVPEMASQMFRGLSDANISCFFTACIAGLMYDPSLETATTTTPVQQLAAAFMNWVPTYDVLMRLLPSL